MTTNGPKWPQNTVFGRVKKLVSWVLSRIAVKRQFLWFVNILWRLETECLEKFLSSSYNRRFLLASETSVFFKYQSLYNRSSSDFEIWHVDRHEWKEQVLLTGFLKKIMLLQIHHLWPKKWRILITLDPLQEVFLNFCTLKSANR